jgi:NAD(P)-dependent dehydrogenase (short-subunit alcohol dehydrogenase family)
MKFLITGGHTGLGLAVVNAFSGDAVSRRNGYDITKDHARIADLSMAYDVFVNNAFDGPFQESWANFGQVQTLWAVADAWREQKKSGYIINIGSVGSESVVAPDPGFETYRVAKSALKEHSRQWTRSFKQDQVKFKTSLLTIDRLDTELTRNRPSWTGNGHCLTDICNYIQLIVDTPSNTCIEEIISYVNFNHKQ